MRMLGFLFSLLGTVAIHARTNNLQENIAIKGSAVQSSTVYNANAERAIDGNVLSCTHTKTEDDPWWRLDLLDIYDINDVTITNRADCCPERLNGAEIRIGNSLENNGNNNPRCAVIKNLPAGASYSYSCPKMMGRYVNVFLPGDKKILALSEVEIFLSVRQTFVRMKFASTSDPDNDKLLYQLQSALALRGITDVKISWTKLPQREQKRDVEKVEEGLCEIIQ